MSKDILAAVHSYASRKGYVVLDSQLSLFEQSLANLSLLAELALPDSPHKPAIKVFRTPLALDRLTAEHFQMARSLIHDKSVSFIAFTNNGTEYRTIATIGSGTGSIGFIPSAPKNGGGSSLDDLRPFLSIYELRLLVSRLSDSIFATQGHDRLKLFDTILMLLAAKIYDEIENPRDLYLSQCLRKRGQDLQDDFQSFCQTALENMGCGSFEIKLYLDPDTLLASLELVAPYSFRLTAEIGAQTEILATFYQEIVSSTFRGSLGAYFTPKPIADLAVEISSPSPDDDILDMTCGSGTFLLSAFTYAQNRNNLISSDKPRLFGCDIQERMVLTTVLNSYLHGVYRPHIISGDALQLDLGNWNAVDSSVPVEGFSLIVGNPPFAGFESESYLPYNHKHKALSAQRGTGARVNKIIPFIVKTVQLLRPGGKAALVIPTSVLNGEAATFTDLRHWLSSEVKITAIIGLPRDAFVHTDCGIEGALLFFEREPAPRDEAKVFFVTIANVGYDRRGRVIPDSEIETVVNIWTTGMETDKHWLDLDELYQLDRWDPTWLEGYTSGLTFNPQTHIRLTDICKVVKRRLSRQEIQPDTIYTYFEVGDTDIDSGRIKQTHSIKGSDLPQKGRLQIPVREGDILLPNHRDSLIAKTAAATGRSVVLVTSKENGYITSNRFTVLKPLIHPNILMFLLNSSFVRQQLVLYARGSASFDVRDKVLDQIWIPRKFIEDKVLQSKILEALKNKEQIQRQLDETESYLNQLMEALNS